MEEDQLICTCFDVYKSEIVKAIKSKELTTLQEVIDVTDAGNGCGCCHDSIQEILDEING
ncbi:MAG: (2Fe-2S)-binding protein [Bacteroidales bacterium]|nr:(2Fe-2S)-binding protein [Bacteroidales bacterium]